jgi:hypothetical protein
MALCTWTLGWPLEVAPWTCPLGLVPLYLAPWIWPLGIDPLDLALRLRPPSFSHPLFSPPLFSLLFSPLFPPHSPPFSPPFPSLISYSYKPLSKEKVSVNYGRLVLLLKPL